MTRKRVWVMWVDQEDVAFVEVYATKALARERADTINAEAKAEDDIDTYATVAPYYIRREVPAEPAP